MAISSKRQFTYNGKKYLVLDVPQRDRMNERERYELAVVDGNGLYNLQYSSIDYHIPKFNTIKEAHEYVRDWGFLLVSL